MTSIEVISWLKDLIELPLTQVHVCKSESHFSITMLVKGDCICGVYCADIGADGETKQPISILNE